MVGNIPIKPNFSAKGGFNRLLENVQRFLGKTQTAMDFDDIPAAEDGEVVLVSEDNGANYLPEPEDNGASFLPDPEPLEEDSLT